MIFPFSGHTIREVISMNYRNLGELLANEPQAKNYFSQLPDHVRDQISAQGSAVDSLDTLMRSVENLTHSDGFMPFV